MCRLHPWRISRPDWIKPWVVWFDLIADHALTRRFIQRPKVGFHLTCYNTCFSCFGNLNSVFSALASLELSTAAPGYAQRMVVVAPATIVLLLLLLLSVHLCELMWLGSLKLLAFHSSGTASPYHSEPLLLSMNELLNFIIRYLLNSLIFRRTSCLWSPR